MSAHGNNLLDRAIALVSPRLARDRVVHRHQYNALTAGDSGGYSGGRKSRRQTSQWQTRTGDADADTLPDIPTLRDRSRDLVRNAPLASGAIATVKINAVGPGLKPKSAISRDMLGLDADQAVAWQAKAEGLWKLWATRDWADTTRVQSFDELQGLAFQSSFEGGDVFAVLRSRERRGVPFLLNVQMFEADVVCNPRGSRDGQKLENGNKLAGGIETDSYGAPQQVWISDRHPGSRFGAAPAKWTPVPIYGPHSGERQVLHLYDRLRVNQTRGVPYLAPVIEQFKMLDRYSEAELMAAVVSAMFTVFVKSESGEGLAPMDPTAETGGSASDQDYKLGNGAMLTLAEGEDVTIADPKRPNVAFDDFTMAVLRQTGAGLGLPLEVLTKHFQSSYSAARGAMLEAWRFYRNRRQWVASRFCQPTWETFIGEQVALGRLDAPGFFDDPIIRAAWCEAQWIGPAQGQIDPLKEIQAAEKRVSLGVSSVARETAEITGEDWRAVAEQRAAEKAVIDSSTEAAPAPPAASPPGEDDPDEADRKEQAQ